MSISSALNASVSGLNANASRLATISDNIANASTYGYKRSTTTFESMVLSSVSGSGHYAAGGVRSQATRLIDERGPLIGTSNALDIAVTGRGMLPVTQGNKGVSEGGLLMTTTGAFRTDANGVLKTPSGLVLLGWPANGDGTIPTMSRDSTSGLGPIVINANQQAGDPTTRMKMGANLPSSATAPGANGNAIPLSVEYFGNLGTSETLDFTFTPTVGATAASNEWRMQVRDSAQANAVVGEYVLTFDTSRANGGSLASVTQVSGGAYNATTGTVNLTLAGGPLALTLGKIGDTSAMTQLDGSFSPISISKDGSPVGKLSEVTVDENGLLKATYDTGFTRTLYQVPLVDVPNVNGLTALDDQTFRISNTSGAFFLWDAGDGPTGTVEGFAREGSTTDMAEELTNLIQTQRAYSSNAKVIQTVDEMLQETTNIKR